MAEESMLDEEMTILTAKEAAEYLRVSLYTLKRMESEGGLMPFRTPGGHRRYSLTMLEEYLEKSRQSPRRRESNGESEAQ
jgi:excisionase family DNA binding protein